MTFHPYQRLARIQLCMNEPPLTPDNDNLPMTHVPYWVHWNYNQCC